MLIEPGVFRRDHGVLKFDGNTGKRYEYVALVI
jgi:hypothetical protein